MDILRPELHDGTTAEGGKIPFAVHNLPDILYSLASVVMRGDWRPNIGANPCNMKGIISLDPGVGLEKEGGALFFGIAQEAIGQKMSPLVSPSSDTNAHRSYNLPKPMIMRQSYANLLQLMGFTASKEKHDPMTPYFARRIKSGYNSLGLRGVEMLQEWLSKEELSGEDRKHAVNSLRGFSQGVLDTGYRSADQSVYLPFFHNWMLVDGGGGV